MFFKRLTRQSVAATYVNFGRNTTLLEEYRHTAPYLYLRDDVVFQEYELLGLYEVGDPTFFIQSTVKISCAALVPAPSADQNVIKSSALQKAVKTANVALNYRNDPLFSEIASLR